MQQLPNWMKALGAAALIVWLTHRPVVDLLVDWLWFDALSYAELFTISLKARAALWIGGFVVTAAFIGLNILHATRTAPMSWSRLAQLLHELELGPVRLRALARLAALIITFGPALLFAGVASSQWLDVLAFIDRQPFGRVDPVFGRDMGFYIFSMPVLQFVQGSLAGLVTVALLPVAAWHIVRGTFVHRESPGLGTGARVHLLGLGALLMCISAVGWWLDRFDLLVERTGAVWGVGYADASARLPAYLVMVGVSLVAAAVLLASARGKSWRVPLATLGGYLALRFIVANAWPSVVQDYFVKPNELEAERPYLERNIEGTRTAYALDRIEVRPFEAATDLTMEDIDANPLTIENIRVWDTRPLLTTYGQLQEIRLYYNFVDVDVDRYIIEGKQRQVMLSARELDYSQVPGQAQSWVNEHFQYTHGYGLTMSPVNVVTEEGLPELFIKDLPPKSVVDIEIERPEIYYGELTNQYVIVASGAEEFDYPSGDENVYTRYAGNGGVGIGSFWRKALFSAHFKSLDILLSQYLKPESKVMFRRNIRQRVEALAPFLYFDADPYLVTSEGRLYWMVDAYTYSNRYPYSEPIGIGSRLSINYIRNSVKVVVDAYHGTVDFYIADEDDPLVQTYARVFPDSFKTMAQMPEGLRSHVRYPVGFFDIQAAMYRAYHMTDPTVFYNKEDMWELPRELYGGQEQEMESYYLIMKLPEEERAEFILLMPFAPTNKDNMSAWLAARCDPDVYGRLILYQFPKQKLVYGPRQIEARIDQNPEISELITLWSQAGSRVVRGNLLVIPIGNSLMYVEPLYLQAETSQLPELQRVIVSYENRIAMKDTLDEALVTVFGAQAPTARERSQRAKAERQAGAEDRDASLEGVATGADWAPLAKEAGALYREAVDAQKRGDWAAYGQALNALEMKLRQLEAEAGLKPEANEGAAPETQSTPIPADNSATTGQPL